MDRCTKLGISLWLISLCFYVLTFSAVAGETDLTGEKSVTNGEADMPQTLITVTATRTERSVDEVPASVTVIGADEIANHRVESPEVLLKNEAGVDLVITPGGLVDRVVLRGIPEGFAGNTTQYLLNGMPVDPVQISTNRAIWHLISPEDIERLEVVRGPASALYGPNAMGGVINIITKRGAGDPFVRADLEGGAHNGRAVGFQGGGSLGDVDLRLSARSSKSDGYRPSQASSWGGSDYDLSGRENESQRFNASLSYWPTDWQELSFGVYYYEQDDEWLGGHPNHRSDSDGASADFIYRNDIDDSSRLTFKLLALDSVTDVYMDNSYEDIPQDPLDLVDHYEDRERSVNAEVQFELEPMEGHTLVLGVSRSAGTWEVDGSERYSDYPDWTRYSKSSDSRVEALFAQDEIDLGEQVILTLGGRYDRYRFEAIEVEGADQPNVKDHVFTPRAGLRYRLNESYSLYTSAGKGYIPANPNLMYRGGDNWLDNEDLKAERTNSWEVGLNFGAPGGALSGTLALYRTDYKDRITSVYVTEDGQPCTNFPCSRQYQNMASIRVEGVEFTLNGKLAERWRPFFNYTLSAAEIRDNQADPESEGNSPAYTPRHKINLGSSYVDDQGLSARIAGRYVSTRYWSERHYEWTELDNFFVVDTKFSQRFRISETMPEIEFSLAVNNLFDEEYMEWRNALADGRNWWLEVTASFH